MNIVACDRCDSSGVILRQTYSIHGTSENEQVLCVDHCQPYPHADADTEAPITTLIGLTETSNVLQWINLSGLYLEHTFPRGIVTSSATPPDMRGKHGVAPHLKEVRPRSVIRDKVHLSWVNLSFLYGEPCSLLLTTMFSYVSHL